MKLILRENEESKNRLFFLFDFTFIITDLVEPCTRPCSVYLKQRFILASLFLDLQREPFRVESSDP